MIYYDKTPNDVLEQFSTTADGLSSTEAKRRLKHYGPNAIIVKGEPLWKRILEPFIDLMTGILAIAAAISVWHHAYFDAIVITAIIIANVTIFYVQRFSTERILKSLQKKSEIKVDVLRDGSVTLLSAEQLVPGDIVMIEEGGKIPADLRVITASSLRVDESQMTGESLPIDKTPDQISGKKEVYEQRNMLFQGSFVISGQATGVVVATGNSTEFGKLAKLSENNGNNTSPVQRRVDKLIQRIIAVVGAIVIVAFLLSLYRGIGVVESLQFVLAVAVSAVPESLPIAISIILALGMRRMAAKKALVRTMSSIETIGVVTTIATDKTGTLTVNKLTAQDVWHPSIEESDFKTIVMRTINNRAAKLHDPLDIALEAYSKYSDKHHEPMTTFPFDLSVAMSGNLWHHSDKYKLYVKGAPEKIMAASTMTATMRKQAEAELTRMTSQGYRVIAVAHADLAKPIDKLAQIGKPSTKLQFAGFVAVADILRPEAKRAIKTALRAGVVVRMITGDHFETAFQIGHQLGLVTSRDQVFDSRNMHDLTDEQLEKIVDRTFVFARVIPEHKHRLLTVLNRKNITAMTGDGVNDVPALTNAHVGLSMGSGTQIAKDAGDIILVDDNFKSIVDAIHEGRTIYSNIKRMLYYLLSTNVGEVLTTVGALAIGIPVPLAPVQILWVNLVTDTSLAIPLGLEPGEKRNMLKPPQRSNAPILSKFMVSRMMLVAFTMAALALGSYSFYANMYDHAYGSTIAFNVLVVLQWASALCARSDYEPLIRRIFRINPAFIVGFVIAVSLQMAALFTPLGKFLHVNPVGVNDLIITSVIAFTSLIVVVEIHKFIGRLLFNKGSQPLGPHIFAAKK